MKTLVVLLTLVAVALAAPRLQEENVVPRQNWHTQKLPGIPEFVKRHRKSTLELPTKMDLETAPNMEISTDVEIPTHTARSFGLKTPVIVKNKNGYRLYRDSEEEKANVDYHESCGRQVKVKLCDEDGKFREMLRSSGHKITDDHTSEADMKHSIILAKEAIENLQRDLKKIEQRSATDNHDSIPDTDLHEDVEVTRQALDDVHKNFENLETISLHATVLGDTEAMHDLHLSIANNEEERMAQWKTAINNIQKNVEIVQNIENSFKVAGGHLDQAEINQNDHKLKEPATNVILNEDRMREVHDMPLISESHDKITTEHVGEEQHARENQYVDEDIEPSASELVEMKVVDTGNHHTLRSENHKYQEHEKNIEELNEHGNDVSNLAFKNAELQEENAKEKLEELVADSRYKDLETNEKINEKFETEQDMFKVASKHFDRNAVPNLGDNFEIGLKDFNGDENNVAQAAEQIGVNSKATNEIKQNEVKANLDNHNLEQNGNFMRSNGIELDHLAFDDGLIFPKNPINESDHEAGSKKMKTAEDNTNHRLRELTVQEETENNMHLDEVRPWNLMKAAEASDQMTLNDLPLMHNHQNINDNEAVHTVTLPGMKSVEEPLNHHLTGLTAIKAAEDKHRTVSIPSNMHWSNENRHFKAAASLGQAPQNDFHLQHTLDNIEFSETEHPTALSDMKSAEDHLSQHLTTLTSVKAVEDHVHHPESSNAHWSNENRHFSSMKATDPSTQEALKDFHLKSQNIASSKSGHAATLSELKAAEEYFKQYLTALQAGNAAEKDLHNSESMPSNARWSNENNHFSSMKATDLSSQEALNDFRSKHAHENINHEISEQTLLDMEPAEGHLHRPLTTLPAMKAANLEPMLPEAHWITENRPISSMKVFEDIEKNTHELDHMRNSFQSEHHFNPHKMGSSHDFEPSHHGNHHTHHHTNQHGHQHTHLPQGHHHNMHLHSDVPSHFKPSFRDAMEGLESEHTFQWKPSHESFRNSYGAGPIGSVGGGAVGVFPNANTGGCGIPLLLSCSPSVVSGSLAKAHPSSYGTPSFGAPSYAAPSYNAPSYRTEDDFGFHNKRDTQKTSETRTTNVLRSPAIVKQ